MDDNRQSDSPARTIDSRDSTSASVDTIVDRNGREEIMQLNMDRSMNTTNIEQQNSLTNSQISMIKKDDDRHHSSQTQLDDQNHIYSSPVYGITNPDSKTQLSHTEQQSTIIIASSSDDNKSKIITHEEFKKQSTTNLASKTNTLDSRINKKQRFPPELLQYTNEGKRNNKLTAQADSSFPVRVCLAIIQLFLSIALVASAALLIVRDASLSVAGCGIWTGFVAAITGSLGVINIKKVQTAFLALSLISIATSTLALAISGIGLSRDINHLNEKFDLFNANEKISAACGLIFILFLHFVTSIISVYRSTIKICSRYSAPSDSNNIGIPEKVDQYIKAMAVHCKEKENSEKLLAMWMYAAQAGNIPPGTGRKKTPPQRPMALIPAIPGRNHPLSSPKLPSRPPSVNMLAPPLMPCMQYRGMTLPYVRPGTMMYMHEGGSFPRGVYQARKKTRECEINSQRRCRRNHQQQQPLRRTGKCKASRRQRRKSETDVLAFTYTGFDREIADSFLERQEQSIGSHMDFSSSGSELYTSTVSRQKTLTADGVTTKA